MSDIDKFHEWVESQSPLALREYTHAQAAWLARGELDAVRIKEVNVKAVNSYVPLITELQGQIAELSLQVAQLREAFAKCLTVTPHYMVSKATAEKWKALAYGTSTPSQDEWIKRSEIDELTAKLDAAKDFFKTMENNTYSFVSVYQMLSKNALEELDK